MGWGWDLDAPLCKVSKAIRWGQVRDHWVWDLGIGETARRGISLFGLIKPGSLGPIRADKLGA